MKTKTIGMILGLIFGLSNAVSALACQCADEGPAWPEQVAENQAAYEGAKVETIQAKLTMYYPSKQEKDLIKDVPLPNSCIEELGSNMFAFHCAPTRDATVAVSYKKYNGEQCVSQYKIHSSRTSLKLKRVYHDCKWPK